MLSRSRASNSVTEMTHILLLGKGEEGKGKKEGRKEGGKEGRSGHSLSVQLRHYITKRNLKSLG